MQMSSVYGACTEGRNVAIAEVLLIFEELPNYLFLSIGLAACRREGLPYRKTSSSEQVNQD
jgi:hypothetical protein